ncbi:hypothetical protein mhp192 [Mesomycoplasma hyopneumoniae 232]|uniref:Uncharacterized protein n=1 Tax=Mesomycoplasma hyopneumoniae (strain 232) TaxID=295358 RepID=Q601L0_MESH2|nr:hypothetical protein mhp192 [Mesomycoplasma hyopneumoniae 232]
MISCDSKTKTVWIDFLSHYLTSFSCAKTVFVASFLVLLSAKSVFLAVVVLFVFADNWESTPFSGSFWGCSPRICWESAPLWVFSGDFETRFFSASWYSWFWLSPPFWLAKITLKWDVLFKIWLAAPLARGRKRFKVGPSLTIAALIIKFECSKPWLLIAFATAELINFVKMGEAFFLVWARIARASETFFPLSKTATRRALNAEIRCVLSEATAKLWFSTFIYLPFLFFCLIFSMPVISSCWGKLT